MVSLFVLNYLQQGRVSACYNDPCALDKLDVKESIEKQQPRKKYILLDGNRICYSENDSQFLIIRLKV